MPRGSGSIIQFGTITVSSDTADLGEVRRVLSDLLKTHGYPTQGGVTKDDGVEHSVEDKEKSFEDEAKELRELLSEETISKADVSAEETGKEPWVR